MAVALAVAWPVGLGPAVTAGVPVAVGVVVAEVVEDGVCSGVPLVTVGLGLSVGSEVGLGSPVGSEVGLGLPVASDVGLGTAVAGARTADCQKPPDTR